MLPSLSYRQATIKDLDILVDWTQSLMTHEQIDESLELPLKADIKEQLRDWLANLMDNDNALIIIADDDKGKSVGGILGIVQLTANDFVDITIYGLIQMVWVNEAHRNLGVASELVKYMEETFKSLDIPYCEIQFSDSNIEAKNFWKKSGYSPVSHTCRKMLN